MSAIINEREIILEILIEQEKGEYLNILLKNVLDKYSYLPSQVRSFIKNVSQGSVERQITIDYIIDSVSNTKVKKMKPFIRNLLRMSTYQLKFMDHVPVSAVIDEAVKLSKKRSFGNLSGFVNGVLRNIDRLGNDIEYPDLSVKYSCPKWLCDCFVKWYGEENAEKMLMDSLEVEKVYAKVLKGYDIDEIIASINRQKAQAARVDYISNAISIKLNGAVTELDAFNEGKITIMDLASSLVGDIAGIKGPEKVIDMCAAPGGKTIHIASMLNTDGCVRAFDISERKLSLIQDNIERCGLHNIEAQISDATVLRQELIESADVVVADLPCSGLGVIGRKPDLKYRINGEELQALKALQQDILKNAVSYLKRGGILLYSTCTVNPGENVKQLKFIRELGLEADSIEEYLPKRYKNRTGENGYLQLLQGVDGCDGFFISRFKKV